MWNELHKDPDFCSHFERIKGELLHLEKLPSGEVQYSAKFCGNLLRVKAPDGYKINAQSALIQLIFSNKVGMPIEAGRMKHEQKRIHEQKVPEELLRVGICTHL